MNLRIQVAERLGNISPYAFATINQRVAELTASGMDIIRLDAGSPDLPPPQLVVDRLAAAARDVTNHGYPTYNGTPSIRRAFADYYARRFEVALNPDTEVLPLLGSKEGLVNIHLALVDPDDVVLVPDPAYPAYERGALLAGATPYPVRLDAARGYLPDLGGIPKDVLAKARIMWINYPNNPTGAIASLGAYAEIVAFCRRHHIILCSDNPYADLVFDGVKPPSVLEVAGANEIAVEFNSLSKTYNMAGWRVGVCVGNADIIAALLQVKSNIDSGMFKPVQDASVAALALVEPEWIATRNTIYQRRRDVIMEALPSIGLVGQVPRGAMYVWARVADGDDVRYVSEALEMTGVSLVPGETYGAQGRGYVRISFVVSEERIREAMNRLTSWYSQRRA